MRRKNKTGALRVALTVLAVLMVALWFLGAVSSLGSGQSEEGRQQLENALRRAAVACYAAEGIYPPDLEYITDHYGVIIDRSRYRVFYEVFATNLMPDITVLER